MGLITIVDENDQVLGSEERKEVYKQGLWHRLIRVLLFNSKGEILLQWRSAQEDTFPNTWDQSAGGHVDAGEDYETAAYRELEEELGVKGAKLELVQVFKTESKYGEKNIKRFNAVFRGEYDGDMVLQEEEVEKVRWFTIEELKTELINNPSKFTDGLKTVLSVLELT